LRAHGRSSTVDDIETLVSPPATSDANTINLDSLNRMIMSEYEVVMGPSDATMDIDFLGESSN